MSMDVACLAGEFRGQGIQTRLEGHTGAPVPPTVMTERGMAYVDTYIKIFYLPTVVSHDSGGCIFRSCLLLYMLRCTIFSFIFAGCNGMDQG